MNKLVIALVIIFVLFTILNAYTAPVNLLEFANDKNNFGIGLGVIEEVDRDRQVWNVFPLHFYVKSGDRNVFLLYNVLSVVFKTGTNYSKPINIYGAYRGDVVSVGGRVLVSGRVDGDIWAFNADVIVARNSIVTGSIVALGGRVLTTPPVSLEGTRLVVSNLQFPLMGIIVSPDTGNVSQLFGFSLFSILFFLLIVFLYAVYGKTHLTGLADSVGEWKGSLLATVIALIAVPLIAVLLIASGAGLLVVPFFLIFLMAAGYAGYTAVAVRVGRLILRGDAGKTSRLFLTASLGFVLIHGVTIIGLLLALFNVGFLKALAGIFLTVGTIISYLAFIYGLGVSLARLKKSMA